MIIPTEFELFLTKGDKQNAYLRIYDKKHQKICTRRFSNISSESYQEMLRILAETIEVNLDRTTPTVFGITEIQWFLEDKVK